MGWREKVVGADGVAKVIIVPLDYDIEEIIEEKMHELERIFGLTTFSEETIVFKILELDDDDDLCDDDDHDEDE